MMKKIVISEMPRQSAEMTEGSFVNSHKGLSDSESRARPPLLINTR